MAPRFIITLLVVGFLAGYNVQGWRLGSKLADERRGRAEDKALQIAAQQKNEREATAYEHLAGKQLAITQEQHVNETNELQTKLDRLNGCLRNGTCGLRIAAHCPAADQVPAGSNSAAAGNSGASARLDAAIEPDYFALRRGLLVYRQRLETCKQYAELTARAIAK